MRLIDAEALDVVTFTDRDGTFSDGVQWILEKIDNLPTIDERKKGKWIYFDPNGFKCSECGGYLEIGCGDVKMNFCPNCGADMRGNIDE